MREQWTESEDILRESIEEQESDISACPEDCSESLGFCDVCALRMDHTIAMRALLRLKQERDEARAEVERLRNAQTWSVVVLFAGDEFGRDGSHPRFLGFFRSEEDAAAYASEVNDTCVPCRGAVVRQIWTMDSFEEAMRIRYGESWDANGNGVIDDAAELAAYAEQEVGDGTRD